MPLRIAGLVVACSLVLAAAGAAAVVLAELARAAAAAVAQSVRSCSLPAAHSATEQRWHSQAEPAPPGPAGEHCHTQWLAAVHVAALVTG